jgi:hypothetical protein
MMKRMPANLDILAKVGGTEALSRLKQQLEGITRNTATLAQAQEMAQKQNAIDIAMTDRRVMLLQGHMKLTEGEINQKARLVSLEQELTYATNHRLEVATDAYTLMNVYKEQGISITLQEAKVAVEANNEIIKSENDKIQAMRTTDRLLMRQSMGLFVMNMAITQITSSLRIFTKDNEAADKALTNLTAATRLAMAPMQAYYAMMLMIEMAQGKVALTAVMMGTSIAAAFLWITAFQQKNKAIRTALFALAGAFTVVAIASWGAATGIATFQTLLGNLAAMAALITGAAVLAGVIGMITVPKGQTLTDHRKRVRKGGVAILDDDEVITRESKGDGTRSGGGDIIINLPDSYNGSMADANITANRVRQYVNSGYGTVKYSRKSMAGG